MSDVTNADGLMDDTGDKSAFALNIAVWAKNDLFRDVKFITGPELLVPSGKIAKKYFKEVGMVSAAQEEKDYFWAKAQKYVLRYLNRRRAAVQTRLHEWFVGKWFTLLLSSTTLQLTCSIFVRRSPQVCRNESFP